MTQINEKHYEIPTINNKAQYLEFKENIQAHDSFNAIDNENMALELHIGQSILDFYKLKYESNKNNA